MVGLDLIMTQKPSPIEAIRFRIEQYGWKDCEFAKEIGMSRSHFSEVMNGKRKMPLYAVRKTVALGVPAAVMLQPFPCEQIRRPKSNGNSKLKTKKGR